MARPIAKWAAQVEHAHDVPRALRRAFKIAAEPPQGPVFLSLPMDVLDAEAEIDIAPTTYTHWHARPDPAVWRRSPTRSLAARQPMLMVGDSVAIPDAQSEVTAWRSCRGADLRVLRHRVQRPDGHPLNLGGIDFVSPRADSRHARECDVLFVVGAPLFQLIFPEAERAPGPPARPVADRLRHRGARQERPTGHRVAGRSESRARGIGRSGAATAHARADAAAAERARQVGERTADGARPLPGRRAQDLGRRADQRAAADARIEAGAAATTRSCLLEAITNWRTRRRRLPTEPGHLVTVRGGGIGPG